HEYAVHLAPKTPEVPSEKVVSPSPGTPACPQVDEESLGFLVFKAPVEVRIEDKSPGRKGMCIPVPAGDLNVYVYTMEGDRLTQMMVRVRPGERVGMNVPSPG